MSKQNTIIPIVIIGGGPSGLAAAVYNARAGLKPVVLAGSPPGGQLMLTTEVENFPGVTGIMGPELVERMRKQAESFGAVVVNENVLKVDFSGSTHKIYLSPSAVKKVLKEGEYTEGQDYVEAKAVIIATGAKALWLNLESEQRLRGKGVSACATCDGFFFRNKEVAIIGGGDSALEEALTLTKFASKVYVIHRRGEFKASKIMQERVLNHPQIEVVWNSGVAEILGEMKVEGIKLTSTVDASAEPRIIPLQGVFVAIGHKPDTELFKGHIALDEKGYIVTVQRLGYDRLTKPDAFTSEFTPLNAKYLTATSREGVFAAGDCVDIVYRQASTASGMGVAASLDAERYVELLD